MKSGKTCFGGTWVQGEDRVIMLYPVASGHFAKADTGGQTCQEQMMATVISLANTHTHICINTHPCIWHVPQEGGDAREGRSSTEIIRFWIHTLWALTPHSPPVGFLPVIVPCSSAKEIHRMMSLSLCDRFTTTLLEGARAGTRS